MYNLQSSDVFSKDYKLLGDGKRKFLVHVHVCCCGGTLKIRSNSHTVGRKVLFQYKFITWLHSSGLCMVISVGFPIYR